MKLCRFKVSSSVSHLGLYTEQHILDLTGADRNLFPDMKSLIIESRRLSLSLRDMIQPVLGKAKALSHDQATLTIPFIPSEVWAAGVTYTRSREARKRETRYGEIYDMVYTAERPELFLKDSGGLRSVGPDEFVRVRTDSNWTVPEPELGVLLDQECSIWGYTIANDMSARDIEGENPLYLPQAKIYSGSCSFGPVILTVDEAPADRSFKIRMNIARAGKTIFIGETTTSMMRRSIDDLVSTLSKENRLGELTLLMTGTGIVPPDDLSLRDGDIVEISIDRIGTLRNPVSKTMIQ